MKTLEDELARFGQVLEERYGPIDFDELSPEAITRSGEARRWHGIRHPLAVAVAGMAAVLVVIGGISLLSQRTTGSGGAFLGVIVTIEPSEAALLRFGAGQVELGSDPWASHAVGVDVATDEYIQTVTLADRYVIEGDELVPAPGSTVTEHTISDDSEPGANGFVVELADQSEGEHRYTLTLPVHLEPKPIHEGTLEPDDRTLEVVFVYDVFSAETPLAVWCVRADQLLKTEAFSFSPEAFALEGEDVLTPSQIADFETAAIAYHEEVDTNQHWDPNEFFDLVEDICDVSYPERWQAYA